jgi:hypothetical protein
MSRRRKGPSGQKAANWLLTLQLVEAQCGTAGTEEAVRILEEVRLSRQLHEEHGHYTNAHVFQKVGRLLDEVRVGFRRRIIEPLDPRQC